MTSSTPSTDDISAASSITSWLESRSILLASAASMVGIISVEFSSETTISAGLLTTSVEAKLTTEPSINLVLSPSRNACGLFSYKTSIAWAIGIPSGRNLKVTFHNVSPTTTVWVGILGLLTGSDCFRLAASSLLSRYSIFESATTTEQLRDNITASAIGLPLKIALVQRNKNPNICLIVISLVRALN